MSKRPRSSNSSGSTKGNADDNETNNAAATPLITPHVERLLRLVAHGAAESATLAAAQITQWTATQPPAVLWYVMGRIQAIILLCHHSWQGRRNAAHALQGVAKHVPPVDQCAFFRQQRIVMGGQDKRDDNDDDDDDDDKIIQDNNHDSNHDNNVLDISLALELAKVPDDQIHHLLLYATAPHRQRQAQDAADEAVLDDTVTAHERLKAQRRILAQRLGWDRLPAHLCHTDTLVSAQDLTSTGTGTTAVRSKRLKTATKVAQTNEDASTQLPTGLAPMLVAALRANTTTTNTTSTTTNTTTSCHQTPQQVLAHEFLYRLWDSRWTQRHGGLVGILALCRAWQPTVVWQSHDRNNVWGPWPRDILARTLLLLVLDRFGDFGACTSTGGAVVAPVRELAAQLVALLWRLAPRDGPQQQQQVWHILCDIVRQGVAWESQHGALLAIKYITVLVVADGDKFTPEQSTSSSSSSSSSSATRSSTIAWWYQEYLTQSSLVAGEALASNHADIVAVAAQILCEHPRIEDPKLLGSIWQAFCNISVLAASVKDLVRLVATTIVPHGVLSQLAQVQNISTAAMAKELVTVLLRLLACPLPSVRFSVLQSLRHLSNGIDTEHGLWDVSDGATLYGDIMRQLFASFIRLTEEKAVMTADEFEEYESVQQQLDCTWTCYSLLCNKSGLVSSDACTSIFRDILVSYYYAPFTMSRPTRYYLLMGPPSIAVATFFQCVAAHEALHSLLLCSLHIFLESPWIAHCEMACGLLQSISSKLSQIELQKCGLDTLVSPVSQMLDSMPLCLQLHKVGAASILDSEWKMKHRTAVLQKFETLTVVSKSLEGFSKRDIQQAIESRGLELGSSQYTSSDLESMRLKASVASTGLYLATPKKITPYVRALMTSIKNETSAFRLAYTANTLSYLLTKSFSLQLYTGARGKIVKTLMGMVQEGSDDNANDDTSIQAAKAIGGYLSSLECEQLANAVAEMDFDRILSTPDFSSSNAVREALIAFESLCRVLGEVPETMSFFIRRYIQGLCLLSCCGTDSSAREKARSCIRFFCTSTSGDELGPAFSFAVGLIDKEEGSNDCLWSCLLLQILCEVPPEVLGTHVKLLLPRILKTMTHSNRKVAETACAVFSVLVRVAPLVDKLAPCTEDTRDDTHTSAVIDHLIQGKPLPHAKLPEAIAKSLRSADVTLRDYQLEGISWIHFLQSVNLNGALCDSMGLGKTVQALVGVALGHEKVIEIQKRQMVPTPRSIVVCPATILNHWVAEIRRFFPGDEIFLPESVTGDSAKRRDFWLALPNSKTNVVVVSYSTMRSDIEHIVKTSWVYCILDEGHVLRNPKTATAIASRKIPSKHRLVLSGTMIQNKVMDVWATFDFLMPNFLGSSKEFSQKFVHPITKSQLPEASAEIIQEGMEKLRLLHQQVLPFILRREKDQVLRELPAKNITDLKCPMSELQRRLYDAFSASTEAKESLALFEKDFEQGSDTIGAKILRILLFLRLICTHPSLIDPKQHQHTNNTSQQAKYTLSSSGKFAALFDLLRDCGVNSDSLLAGDQDDSLLLVGDTEGDADSSIEDVGVSVESVDVPLSSPHLPGIVSHRPKCLIFAQFSQTLDAIENFLFKPHMPSLKYLRLDGSVPSEDRVDVANRFNSDSSISVLLLTTRVGSLGLNLTGASIVVFMEHDFNPFVDEQAMDRAHRIGQRAESVNVYRLIASDSIDEKIMDIQRKKVAMSRAVVNTENSTLYSMGTDRLLDIFNTDAGQSNDEDMQDLDAVLANYAKDYESLSVDEFIKSFVARA